MNRAAIVVIDAHTGLLLGVARNACDMQRLAGGAPADLYLVNDDGRRAIERGDIRPMRFASRIGRLKGPRTNRTRRRSFTPPGAGPAT